MEIFRIRRTLRDGLIINDPQPIENGSEAWATAAQISTVGIFVLLAGTAIYLCSPVVLPATAALVVGLTLAPLVNRAKKAGIPPWLSAVVLVILLMVVLGAIVTMIAAPVSEWIGRAPQVGETIRQKLYVFDQPLSALRDLQKIFIPSDDQRGRRAGIATEHGDAGARLRHAGGGAGRHLFRGAAVLPRQPRTDPPLFAVAVCRSQRQAARHPHLQRHRTQSCVLSGDGDADQYLPRHRRRGRRMGVRHSQPASSSACSPAC